MKYIPLDKLEDTYNRIHGENSFNEWLNKASIHLENIKELSKSERGKYWSRHNIWTNLYSALSELSNHTCWYSESPENSGEWEVDHYRPKAISKNIKGEIILSDGYWWLSYDWNNFRLSGALVNKLRKDRFNNEDEVYGKGSYFPLADENNVARENDEYCSGETPLLIDPINPIDVTLISFDKNGEPYPTYSVEEDSFYYEKAIVSIKYYGLKHTPLNRGRKKIWSKCHTIVNKAHNEIKIYSDDVTRRRKAMEECFSTLVKYSSREQPYTMVVKNYLSEKIQDNDYSWLKTVNRVIGA